MRVEEGMRYRVEVEYDREGGPGTEIGCRMWLVPSTDPGAGLLDFWQMTYDRGMGFPGAADGESAEGINVHVRLVLPHVVGELPWERV